MEKNFYAAISLSSIYSVALVIALHNNNTYVVAKEKVLTQGYSDGRIVDKLLFKNTISNLLDAVKSKYNINIDETIVVLPNNNHKVYSASIEQKIMTERQIIGVKQIQFARDSIRGAKLADNEVLVDEVPTLFTLDYDRSMRSFPINYQSSTLTVRSNIHTLPKDIVEDIVNEFSKNNVHILASYINCHCSAFAVSKQYELEDNCICINIGQDVTTISAYSKNLLARSSRINFGLKTLIDYLASNLNIPFTKAMELFESYFIADISFTSDIMFDKENSLNEKRISAIVLNQLIPGFLSIKDEVLKIKKEVGFDDSCKYNLSGLLNEYECFIDVYVKETGMSVSDGTLHQICLNDPLYIECFGAIKLFCDRNLEFVRTRLTSDDDEIEKPKFDINAVKHENQSNDDDNTPKSRFKDIFDE